MPAAVPLTAAITGFSQSKMADISLLGPDLDASGHFHDGPVGGSRRPHLVGSGHPQVGAGAKALAGGGEDHRPHREILADAGELVSQVISLVGGDGIVGVGPVQGEVTHAAVLGHQDVPAEDFGDIAVWALTAHAAGTSSSVAFRAEEIIAELPVRKR